MIRLLAAAIVASFVGTTLLLSEFRWFRYRSLASRVSPYLPGGRLVGKSELLSVESFSELLRPLSEAVGALGARTFGVNEELPRRLRRIHSELDPSAFRVRQMGWAILALMTSLLIMLVLGLPAAIITLGIVTAPLLTFLIVEQRLAQASDAWKQRTFQELPVVAEQIAMLLGSGYSLGAALSRVASRGSGVIAQDLVRVNRRIRQGASDIDALREWAELVDVDVVRRLVSILSLNREAGDLGSMVATEARNARAEAHRNLLASIERKNQQVWIPVTLATLVPGVILMAIPFFDALSSFGT